MTFKQARYQYFFKVDLQWVLLSECITENSNSTLTPLKPIACGLPHYYGLNIQFEDINQRK